MCLYADLGGLGKDSRPQELVEIEDVRVGLEVVLENLRFALLLVGEGEIDIPDTARPKLGLGDIATGICG